MKQTVSPCSIIAAAGTEETMRAILQILADVQSLTRSSRKNTRTDMRHSENCTPP